MWVLVTGRTVSFLRRSLFLDVILSGLSAIHFYPSQPTTFMAFLLSKPGKDYGSVTPKDDMSHNDDSKDEIDYSEGGLAAWLTVFGAFLALFCSFGQMNAFGTFQSWYTTHQLHDLHPSTVAWIGSVQLWVFFFSVRIPPVQASRKSFTYRHPVLGGFHWPHVRRIWAAAHNGAWNDHLRCEHPHDKHRRRVP